MELDNKVHLQMEVTTTCPQLCQPSLQYDGKPDWRIVMRVKSSNMDSTWSKGREPCEELDKRMTDVYGLQELRRRGQSLGC